MLTEEIGKHDLIVDLSILTTIEEKVIRKFFHKFVYCLCEGVKEDNLAGIYVSEFNFELGNLYIKHENKNDIKFKFIPCKALKKNIEETTANNSNVLEDILNKTLSKKFMEVYKNLC